ncbi:MAG: outer membrane lipid asymmetry maintenance protein MlaD [Pseudomonadota bacterium]
MSNSVTETVVGAAVLSVAVGFLIYASQFLGGSASADAITAEASFRSANGISVGTDVRMAGVKVGSVTDVELDPVTFRAITEFSIDRSLDIPDDSVVIVASEGLLGGNFVEILPGGSAFNIEDGGEFLDTQGSVSLIELLLKFVGSSGE